jgi:small-conductance mechanosensitive channel
LNCGPVVKEVREVVGNLAEYGPPMEKIKRFSLETVFVLLLTVLGVVIVIISLSYGFGTFRRPGPGLYPFFIGLFIVFFSLLLLPSGIKPKARPALFAKEERKTFLLMIGAFCLWILMMPLLGYVVVTFFVTFSFCRIMKLERWWKPITVSTGTALFIYLLFDFWLYIDLPKGFLG